jgi:hypothetical protein
MAHVPLSHLEMMVPVVSGDRTKFISYFVQFKRLSLTTVKRSKLSNATHENHENLLSIAFLASFSRAVDFNDDDPD